MLAWGVQAYLMKLANEHVGADSIFFYMTVGALLLVPVAWAMTDFGQPINLGLDGPWMAAAIQILNAIGALTLVLAFRYGKAIVVAPLTNTGAPLITAALAMLLAGVVPGPDRKSTRLNSSHPSISYAVFCLKKKNKYHAQMSC